jgi:hypothetical protein
VLEEVRCGSWQKNHGEQWPYISIRLVLGLGLVDFKNEAGRALKGSTILPEFGPCLLSPTHIAVMRTRGNYSQTSSFTNKDLWRMFLTCTMEESNLKDRHKVKAGYHHLRFLQDVECRVD